MKFLFSMSKFTNREDTDQNLPDPIEFLALVWP